MKNFERRAFIVAVVSALVYVGFALYADVEALGGRLGSYAWWTFIAALLLSCGNYAVRWWRWELYLKRLEIEVPRLPSAEIFIAGFALSATPGKIGELLKSLLLKRLYGVAAMRSAPVVVAERLTDFIALSLLAALGVVTFHFHTTMLLLTVGVVLLGTALLASERGVAWGIALTRQVPLLRRVSDRLESLLETMRVLLRPGILTSATLLSVLGWGIECVGFLLILKGLGAHDATLLTAVFIHATSTILGAVSMLPGGVGLTEALMVSALLILGVFPDEASAVAATLLNRLATLWFAVLLGFFALAVVRRRGEFESLDLEEA